MQSRRYPESAEQYKKLLEFKITDLESLPILEKLASCYMRGHNWNDAVPVLLLATINDHLISLYFVETPEA